MAQYALFGNPAGSGYLLDVQSDLLDDLNVRAVVPLLPQDDAPGAASRLNPMFEIEGTVHVMMPQYIAAVPATILKTSLGDLSPQAASVTAALDMLFHGF